MRMTRKPFPTPDRSAPLTEKFPDQHHASTNPYMFGILDEEDEARLNARFTQVGEIDYAGITMKIRNEECHEEQV